jgi:hypothetical protein
MVGVNPPGHFLWEAQTTDEQIARYAELCSRDVTCSARTADLVASMRRTAADMPRRWLFLPIEEDNVRVASFFGLMESAWAGAQPSASMTLDAWLSAAEGDASGFWFQSLFVDLLMPDSFVWGHYAAAASLDAQAAREYFSSDGQDLDSIGYAGTAVSWGGGLLADAWPAAPDGRAYSRVRRSDVETLVLGGELDTSTPPEIATKELLPYLTNGHEVVLTGFGHTASFWATQPEAGTRLITAFFDRGRVDTSLYEPQSVDFTPAVRLTALGTWIGGMMIGLALLAVLSLLWMARRVSGKGGFGPKAGATLRSVFPVVLGVGGWFLGVLVILATGLSVPLDNELLEVLAVSVPIGLGIYWAWVHGGWSSARKIAGFAAATGGALLGGWLGSHATDEGLFSLFTAIVGAAVGANLIVIVLDISGARSSHHRHDPPVPVSGARAHVGA